MGDNLDKTETGETLESGLNEAGNLASKGLDIANRISDKKSKDGSEKLPDKKMSLVILVTRQKKLSHQKITREVPGQHQNMVVLHKIQIVLKLIPML